MGIFFLRELIFADRGQSANIRTRKIFMLHGISLTCIRNSQQLNV